MIDRLQIGAPSVSLLGDSPPVVGVGAAIRARVLSADVILRSCDGRVCTVPAEVLRAGVALWDGQPLKVDHDRSVLATVGRLSSPSWTEATADCPAGVDADLDVRAEVSEEAATVAALLASRLVSCVSSTFGGEWTQSHPDMDPDTFWACYGTEVDGRIVCEVMTRLAYVREVSIVDRGGDPHSRRLRAPDEEYVMAAMTPASLVAAILPLMGLAPDTSMEDLLSAIGKVLMGKDPEKKDPPEPPADPNAPPAAAAEMAAPIFSLLGVTSMAAAQAEIIRMKTDFVPRSAAPSQVAIALAEGRITPAERTGLEAIELTAPDGLRLFLAGRPKNSAVNLGGSQVSARQPDPLPVPIDLSPEAIANAKKLGLDPADVAARAARMAG